MAEKNNILVLFAHPVMHKSKTNSALLESIEGIEGITTHNLYEQYPDFHIDIKSEQSLLAGHDIIVWQHPFYWYSSPAIIKEWIDLVLEHGFAYGRKGKALAGKAIFNAITTGGRKEAYSEGGYNNFTINQLLMPFKQTASLCSMDYLPPFVVHGTHLLNPQEMKDIADDYKKILISLRDGIFSREELYGLQYLNDILKMNKNK